MGEESGVRDFLSFGSTSRSGGSEGCSGRGAGGVGVGGEEMALHVASLHMLTSLSRNGLSMLAGGSNGGFSLKPAAVGGEVRTLPMGGSKVTGGGFAGFYRRSGGAARGSLAPGVKLRLKSEDGEDGGLIGGSKVEPVGQTDVENLSPGECWRLILKLGSRWPAWNVTAATPAAQATQGLVNERSGSKEERVQGFHLGQDSLRFLATRALEALAQTPDRLYRPSGGMLAPKWTTQEMAKTKAPAAASKSTQATTTTTTVAAVVKQPSLSEVPVSPSQEMASAAKATPSSAPLTIFYAGTVNVCDNVPEDKARLIMLFAEKAGVSANERLPSAVADISPQVTPPSKALSEVEVQLPKPSSEVAVVASSAPAPSANDVEESGSEPKLASEISTPAETVPADPSPVPVKITITEDKSRQQRPPAKPLPNARKNSLARFLDSRKRPTASSSEGPPSKKQALSDGCPSDAEDVKGSVNMSAMPLCSQSSVNSKEGIVAYGYSDVEMRD